MAPALKLPDIVKFRPEIWNSRPLDEDYLRTMFAKKFCYMDENQCRMTLINLFTVLNRYREVLEERMREIMRASISTMICGLAVNIRIYRDVALLLQTDGRIETQVDVPVGDGMQKPIEFRQQLSTEVKDATRNIAYFDIIGPALAWAAVQYLAGVRRLEAANNNALNTFTPTLATSVYPLLEYTVRTELERFRKMGVELKMPRGCLRILEKALPRLGIDGLLPIDARTLVKTAAVFFKHVQPTRSDPECLMFSRQLERFMRVFIADGLGAWAVVEDITNGRPQLVACLFDSIDEICTTAILETNPELAKALETLRNFRSSVIIKGQLSFMRNSHMSYCVYETGMLSYLNANLAHNKVLVDCLQRAKDQLDRLCQLEQKDGRGESRTISSMPQSDTETNNCDEGDAVENVETIPCSSNHCSSDNNGDKIKEHVNIDELAKAIANLYRTKSQTSRSDLDADIDDTNWGFDDFWTEWQNLIPARVGIAGGNSSCSSKKRRRRNRRRS
ncbi:uncharacterized protein LOC111245521 [Varroa destructor]|uniref:Uncharacterized protein n=1 Tax=Varroa destructor TaxID=109461 RepID=A0A7M7JBS3_VARDE|nr:uncharacterized protein LOC111245521 [Varroa destructor]XP_022649721.1 uncharacterized protein LOC111245521 [Varroa destructor]XP_022649722.1 uncharacterized protein LOC111245521 [Varroa destructor]XP_022649723.1 uncharacterized protein LOC111245521 [Varroa destructor]XP_022649724.1 uncharacterized protein LOC111245521 [Varroa destructor]XP_022649726.1 uncharacterized protein LOC111245521 [Varroa destructor]XP_022649727.1 uncharacterized protein LOC111245521 [Varroa destructor]